MNQLPMPFVSFTSFILRLTLVLLVAITSISTHAQNEGRRYTVEVLVFKRTASSAYNQEFWRSDSKLSYPNNYQYLSTSSDTTDKDFAFLPQDTHQLGGYNYTLRRDENYKVLFHQAWKQTMVAKEDAPAIVVQGGQTIANGKEMQGYIRLHIARYLHLNTNLWLNAGNQSSDVGLRQTQLFPPLPGRGTTNSRDSFSVLGHNLNSTRLSSSKLVTFREQRRMRSGELHYIDHPLLGLLILVTPIES
jgi:hypothetical protein